MSISVSSGHTESRSRCEMSDQEKPKEGPGAALATNEIPLIEVEHSGHTLEPEWKRLPIGPDHILSPLLIRVSLFPILMCSAGHHLPDALPAHPTTPSLPTHSSPSPLTHTLMTH